MAPFDDSHWHCFGQNLKALQAVESFISSIPVRPHLTAVDVKP